ncbi:MAG: sigma-54-dependent transcriptional regulator [Solirubrobacterales bacterium]
MRILLVDDESRSRLHLANFLTRLGHTVVEASNGQDALTAFEAEEFHVILTDIRMPVMSGVEMTRSIRELPQGKTVDIVFFTAYGDVDTAVEALRAGVYDYMTKPVNIKELVSLIERVEEHQALLKENRVLTRQFDEAVRMATQDTERELAEYKTAYFTMIGRVRMGLFSSVMRQVYEQAMALHRDRSVPVLIEGETGTGKELIARIVHFGEDELDLPFMDINCAALAPNLFESELFGYEGGAFTGGLPKGQKGKFDLASGGSLFLDEISEIPSVLQAKLLRVLQEKEYYRVGGLRKIATDARVICATNTNLAQMVEAGTFRRDLFHRLSVGRIQVPPLRQRKEEIQPLAEMFLAEFARVKKKRFQRIGAQALKRLVAYDWPGNVRELRNAIEWIVLMWDDIEVHPRHLGILSGSFDAAEAAASAAGTPSGPNEAEGGSLVNWDQFLLPQQSPSLDEITNRIVLRALAMFDGNKTETAKYLGISLRSLNYRLKQISNE